jgi:uncharacterized membrane protein
MRGSIAILHEIAREPSIQDDKFIFGKTPKSGRDFLYSSASPTISRKTLKVLLCR